MTTFEPLPPGPFSVIYADAPWRYDRAVEAVGQQVEQHYPTIEVVDLCALPVQRVAGANSILFMWATAPKLPEALRVMFQWGFTYKTQMVWIKTYASGKPICGMGYYSRVAHELLLIGTRGSPGVPAVSDRPCSVIVAPRGRHSEKPVEARHLIETMYPAARRLELFARGPVPVGWTTWGLESVPLAAAGTLLEAPDVGAHGRGIEAVIDREAVGAVELSVVQVDGGDVVVAFRTDVHGAPILA